MKRQQTPCNTQNQEQVENYYRDVKAGDTAVIRATQGNVLRYHWANVVETKKGESASSRETLGAHLVP